MKSLLVKLLLTNILLSYSTLLLAVDLDEQHYPKSINLGEQTLVLNGAGFRKLTIFRIRIYALGLYLTETNSSANVILNSTKPKRLLLKFARSVGRQRLYDAFEESVRDNYPELIDIGRELAILQEIMPDVKDGDSIEFDLLEEAVHIKHNNKNEIVINSTKFQKAILLIWLGPEPAGQDLKEAILGLVKP